MSLLPFLQFSSNSCHFHQEVSTFIFDSFSSPSSSVLPFSPLSSNCMRASAYVLAYTFRCIPNKYPVRTERIIYTVVKVYFHWGSSFEYKYLILTIPFEFIFVVQCIHIYLIVSHTIYIYRQCKGNPLNTTSSFRLGLFLSATQKDHFCKVWTRAFKKM